MMASSSSSNLSEDHLLQDDLPWPSSSLPFPTTLHHTIGANDHWTQPLMFDHFNSDELEALLSAQGNHHSQPTASSPTSRQLSSLLMMQELGLQWSNCASPMLTSQQDGNGIKEEELLESQNNPRSSQSAGLPELDGIVLPSVNVSRLQKPCSAMEMPLAGGDAFEMIASARLCKTLLSQAATSVLLRNAGMPLLREHVPYDPLAHLQGPSIHNYKMGAPALANGNAEWRGRGGDNGGSASCQQQQEASKKPRLESRPSTIVPSFKARKEKLGDRIAALQQLVSPFGKTDTASVLMEAIGYIKFLQDQVETLSGPYMRSSKNKKAKTSQKRGPSNAAQKEEAKLDLRSRGLCLVPLSCTSYVTNENGPWTPPNFRGN